MSNATRLLIVDDEEALRKAFARVLRPVGSVEVAATGEEALALVSSEAFDVVLTDLGLPGIDGISLLQQIRRHDLDVPVIVITGTPDLTTAIDAVEHGAFRYLVKPVDIPVLIQVTRRAVLARRMARLQREAVELTQGPSRALGDRAALEARFTSALEQLWMAFQPIVRWSDRRIYAYEALARTDEPTLRSPVDLFDAAERLGRVEELGRAIRAAIAEQIPNAPQDALIFVNVHPDDLSDDDLFAPDAPLSAYASRVVIEVTERSSLHGISGIRARIQELRALGYRIALDDLGAGYAGLSCFTLLEPDIVKLDRSLVQDLHADERKLSIVRALVDLCGRELGMMVVGEGIELSDERDALTAMGCDVLQGWLFAKASKGFTGVTLD